MFQLDQRLQNDTYCLGSFPLSLLLMSKDANYPWFILVPQREGLTELYHLDEEDMAQFNRESRHLSIELMEAFGGEKLNVAALGNVVSQLHIHHVVRYAEDIAWPAPIWGAAKAVFLSDTEVAQRAEKLCKRLGEGFKPDAI